MSTYTWAWSDEESTYINYADSLFEIVDTVLDYYYWDEDDGEEKLYTITELNGKFLVSIPLDEKSSQYEVDACSCDVIIFLETLARLEHRPDTFAIRFEVK
jgi:hypothetical protein